jgi:hypothetical protein
MSSQSYLFNPTERTLAAAGDGFSAPRLTTTDRLALTLGVNGKGMMVYDTTLTTLCLWNGVAWEFIIDNSNGVLQLETISNIRTANLGEYSDKQQISIGGYYSVGDGGGGDFYLDLADVISADNGFNVIISADGKRVKAIFNGMINARRAGMVSDWNSTTWTGTDNTVALQKVIDYVEAVPERPTVFIPAGIYGINSVRAGTASIFGERTSNSPIASPGTCLCQKSGATGDMIKADLVSYAYQQSYADFRYLNLIGSYERNLINPRPISSVTSRTQFRVAVADLPQAYTATGTFPFYGFCFFYTSQGQYLGHGVVVSINPATGDVTLYNAWDNYATTTVGAGLLTPSDQVVFSPVFDGSLPGIPAGRSDSTAAGYAGISCMRTGFKRITECSFRYLHVGIRLGESMVVDCEQCWSASCAFSGIASAVLGAGADDSWQRVFTQGQYSSNYGRTYTIPLSDVAYQKTSIGFYGPRTRMTSTDATSDECVIGIIDAFTFQLDFKNVLLDKCVKEAIISFGGTSTGNSLNIFNLEIATPNFTLPSAITYFSGSRTAIFLAGGTARQLTANVIDVIRFPSAPVGNDYTNLISAISSNEVSTAAIRSLAGYTNISSSGNYPRIGEMIDQLTSATLKRYGSYRKSITDVGYASNGSEAVTVSVSTLGANPLVGIGNTGSISTRDGIDLKKAIVCTGLDQVNRALRTNFTTHEGWWTVVPYDLSQSNVVGFGVVTSLTSNIAHIGGGIGDRQSCTRLDVYLASSVNTAIGTLSMQMDTSTTATQTGLRLDYNGTMRRVEVGAADSGGVGYRMLRILN